MILARCYTQKAFVVFCYEEFCMSKDDATWLNICYVLFGVLIGYVGFRAVYALGLEVGWTERYDEWFPTLNNVLAVVIGVASAWCIRSSPERREYHLASIGELRKVTWPTLEDTKKMTIIVAIVVAICSVIMTGFDLAWAQVLKMLLPDLS
jgi:preprotein translocase subunit SecE